MFAILRTNNGVQQRRVRSLALRGCANCDGGDCLLLDCPCPQAISFSLLCRYFREAVLPGDGVLYAELTHEGRTCTICGRRFRPGGNRAKYCPECAHIQALKRHRERGRKYRAKA